MHDFVKLFNMVNLRKNELFKNFINEKFCIICD